jgi:hypothetical protein
MDRVGKVKIPMFDLVSRVRNLQFNKAVENSVRTSLTYAIKRQCKKFVKNKKVRWLLRLCCSMEIE